MRAVDVRQKVGRPPHQVPRARRREDLEGVLRVGNLRVHDRPWTARAQRGGEAARLVRRRQRVAVPVREEERRRAGPDLIDGRRLGVRPRRLRARLLHHHALEEPREPLVRPVPVAIREIVDPIEADARLHRRVRELEARLVARVVRRQRRQRAEVGPRRVPADGDELRIRAVLRRVLPDPGERALHVDEVIGERDPRG